MGSEDWPKCVHHGGPRDADTVSRFLSERAPSGHWQRRPHLQGQSSQAMIKSELGELASELGPKVLKLSSVSIPGTAVIANSDAVDGFDPVWKLANILPAQACPAKPPELVRWTLLSVLSNQPWGTRVIFFSWWQQLSEASRTSLPVHLT